MSDPRSDHASNPDQLMARALGVCWHSPTSDRWPCQEELPMTPVPSSPVALLDQLDELRAKATPGPWAQHSADGEYVIGEVGEDEDGNLSYLDVADCYGYRSQRGTADAALIVAAVNAVEPLTAAVRAVLELHRPFGIYTECDHDHQDENEPGVVEIDMVGLTCREGLMYEVCVECCIEDGPFEQFQFEHCADHHEHETGKPICSTVAAITAALSVTP